MRYPPRTREQWRLIQLALAEAGFDPGPIDGIRGPKTDAGITAFKAAIGYRARPYYGPLTHEALMGAPNPDLGDLSVIPWYDEARRIMGLHEGRNTAALRQWFHASVAWIDPREIPWCGAFVATCLQRTVGGQVWPDNPLGARQWQGWGREVTPSLGALLVFWRGSRSGWKGHVGFYHAEDETHFHVLGGNQSNAVTVSRIAKSRLLSARWPERWDRATTPIWVTPGGVPVTVNES